MTEPTPDPIPPVTTASTDEQIAAALKRCNKVPLVGGEDIAYAIRELVGDDYPNILARLRRTETAITTAIAGILANACDPGEAMITPTNDPINMMTDDELRIAVAVNIFNFRWMKYPAPNMQDGRLLTGIFPPDAPGRWPCANHYYKIWQPSDEYAPRFSNFFDVVWWDNEGEIVHRGIPDYPHDIAAAWEVKSKLTQSGEWGFVFENDGNGYCYCEFTMGRKKYDAEGDGKPEDEAACICRAALRAVAGSAD